jgi:hypothetical protein
MCMPVLDVRTWPRGDVLGLGLTDEDVGLLRGVNCDSDIPPLKAKMVSPNQDPYELSTTKH